MKNKHRQAQRLQPWVRNSGEAALLAAALALVGCAAPSEPRGKPAVYEAPETVTGSMLKRNKDKAVSDPAELEQARRDAATQSAVRIDNGAPR